MYVASDKAAWVSGCGSDLLLRPETEATKKIIVLCFCLTVILMPCFDKKKKKNIIPLIDVVCVQA